MRQPRLVLLAAASALVLPAAAAAAAAAAASTAPAPTMIHTNAELQHALTVNIQGERPSVVVASGDAQCQATLQQLGLLEAVRDREGLGLLLLSPDSSPELQAKLNLTSCHDLAFIDPAYGSTEAEMAAVDDAPHGADATEAALLSAAAAAAQPVHFAPTSSHELRGFLQDVTGGINVAFANTFPFAIVVYWVNPSTVEEVQNARLAAGQTGHIVSFRGHRFALRGEKMGTLLGFAEVQRDQTFFAKEVVAASVAAVDGSSIEACSYPEQGFDEDMAEARRVEAMRESCHVRRLGHNRDQTQWVHHFNALPFKKTKVPPALWAEVQRFFHEQRAREIQEGWPYGDCYTNAHEVPTSIVTLTDTMRQRIFTAVKPVLEEWIGGDIPLEPTSSYGIRLYHRGAVLYKHLDRLETHAVSAIINVAQSGMDEPWPLQIHDHDGQEHTVLMEPGDMVLYESASAVHGREIALQGDWYANFFTHFRPRADSKIKWDYTYAY